MTHAQALPLSQFSNGEGMVCGLLLQPLADASDLTGAQPAFTRYVFRVQNIEVTSQLDGERSAEGLHQQLAGKARRQSLSHQTHHGAPDKPIGNIKAGGKLLVFPIKFEEV